MSCTGTLDIGPKRKAPGSGAAGARAAEAAEKRAAEAAASSSDETEDSRDGGWNDPSYILGYYPSAGSWGSSSSSSSSESARPRKRRDRPAAAARSAYAHLGRAELEERLRRAEEELAALRARLG